MAVKKLSWFIIVFIVVFLLQTCFAIPVLATEDDEVHFDDPEFERWVRDELNDKPTPSFRKPTQVNISRIFSVAPHGNKYPKIESLSENDIRKFSWASQIYLNKHKNGINISSIFGKYGGFNLIHIVDTKIADYDASKRNLLIYNRACKELYNNYFIKITDKNLSNFSTTNIVIVSKEKKNPGYDPEYITYVNSIEEVENSEYVNKLDITWLDRKFTVDEINNINRNSYSIIAICMRQLDVKNFGDLKELKNSYPFLIRISEPGAEGGFCIYSEELYAFYRTEIESNPNKTLIGNVIDENGDMPYNIHSDIWIDTKRVLDERYFPVNTTDLRLSVMDKLNIKKSWYEENGFKDTPVYKRLLQTMEEVKAFEALPTPTPAPTKAPTPTPKPTLTPTPKPSSTPTPVPTPTEQPSPTPTPEPSPTPTPEPSATPTSTPTPEPSIAPTATATPTIGPSPTPVQEEMEGNNTGFYIGIGGVAVIAAAGLLIALKKKKK